MNVPISPRAYPGQLSSVMCAVASQSPEHYVIDNNPEPEPESETTLSGVSSLMKSFSQMPLGSIRSIASWTSSRAITSASKSKPKSHSGEEEGEDQEGNNESDVVQEEETTTQTQYESTEAAAGVGDVNESISVESDENLNTDDPSESNPSRILENLRTFYENTSTSSSAFFASVKSSVSKLTKRRIKKPVSKPKPYNSSSGGVNWRNAPVAFPSTRSNQKPTKSYLPSFLTKSKNPKPPTAMSLARAAVKASEPGKDPRGFLSSLMKIKPGGNKKKPVPANSRTGQSTLPTPSTQDTQRRPQRRPS